MGYQTTFSSLRAEVINIVDSDNPEFLQYLDRIIARAHDNVQRDLDLTMWRTFPTITVNAGVATFPRDPSWLRLVGGYIIASGKPVEKRSLDYLRAYGDGQGVPRCFAERNEATYQLAPIPSVNTTLELEVLTRLPTLNNEAPTSWITQNAADLLLLQTLIGSELYLLGTERVVTFKELYQIQLASAVSELKGSARPEYTPVRAAPKPKLEAA
jgi:hypothetical protein